MPPAPVNRTLLIAGLAAAVVACAAVVYFVSRPSESGAGAEEEAEEVEEEEEESEEAGAKAGSSSGSAVGGTVTKAKLMAVLKDMSSNLQTFEVRALISGHVFLLFFFSRFSGTFYFILDLVESGVFTVLSNIHHPAGMLPLFTCCP